MEPNKFEKHLKQKLEKRELQVSSNAWEQLEQQLDAKPKRRFNYKYIIAAASIVLIFMLGFSIFKKAPSKPEMVDVETKILKEDTIISEEYITEEQPSEIIKPETLKKNITKEIKETIVKEESKIAKTKIELKTKTETLKPLITDTKPENLSTVATSKPVSKTNLKDQKVNEVVAQVKQLQSQNTTVTEAEVDALLKQAQQEIAKERLYNSVTKKVDAMALLESVENEIDNTFRDRVYEALKQNFIKVQTAVAERND